MPTKHGVNEGSKRFKIDPESRNITNRLSSKTVLVQGDINSERLVFELPRFIAGHDMTLSDKIEVHYINIKEDKTEQSEDVYKVKDIAAIPDSKDLASFSWLVSGNATKYTGALAFLIRFSCMKDDELVYAWHTNIYDNVEVGKGMNNGEAVITKYSDILEAWKAEILAKLRAEMEGDINALREQIDMTKAEAIAHADSLNSVLAEKQTKIEERVTDLEAITLTYTNDTTVAYEKAVPSDVASYALLKSIGGASKASLNILNPNKITSNMPITANEDGSITVISTSALLVTPELEPGTYYLAIETVSGWVNIIVIQNTYEYMNPNTSFTLTEKSALEIELGDLTNTEGEAENFTLKIAIFEGSTERTYEPYIDGFENAEVSKIESIGADGTPLLEKEIPKAVRIRDDYGKAYYSIEFNDKKVYENKAFAKMVLNGSEAWEKYDYNVTYPYFYLNVGDSGSVVGNAIINDGGCTVVAISASNTNLGMHITNSSTGFARILMRPADYVSLTLDEFKARLAEKPINVMYKITKPIVTDITHLFPEGFDELKVERGGTIRFVNEHKMSVPNTIGYVTRKE